MILMNSCMLQLLFLIYHLLIVMPIPKVVVPSYVVQYLVE